MDLEFKCSKRRIPAQVTPNIKWWRLKEEKLKIQFREKVLSERRLLKSVQEWWEENSMVILRAGQEVLGMSTARRPPLDKQTWWRNDEVKDAIRAKKEAKMKWETPGRQEERYIYRQANKEATQDMYSKTEGDRRGVQRVGNIGARTKYLQNIKGARQIDQRFDTYNTYY